MEDQKDFMDKVNIESTIRSESDKYNKGTKNAQLIHEILNSAENWQPIIDKIKYGKARDISDEPKATNKNCFILGSGPSLDDSIQYLKDWKGGIICTTSHAMTLMYYGIEPTHILVLDPFCQWSELQGVDWRKTKTKLIMHPGCYPDLVKNWPNEILLYLQNPGRPDSFYSDEQQKMYSHRTGDFRLSTFNFYIRTGLTIFACSPPMQMFAGEVLGYEKFFLAGCDFAYHSDKDRFTDYTVVGGYLAKPKGIIKKNRIEWLEHKHLFNPENPRLVKTNSGLLSEPIHIYYLKNMVSAWRLCGKTMYTTDHGAMTQVPYIDIKEAIEKKGDFPIQSISFINKITEEYLATTGAYVVETEKGVSFVESSEYEKEIPNFMMQINSRYICDKCKNGLGINPLIYSIDTKNGEHFDFINPDQLLNKYLETGHDNVSKMQVVNVLEINHSGEDCPICKEGKLHREANIDIEKNMKRIRARITKENYDE
jgi:hypothetical protein